MTTAEKAIMYDNLLHESDRLQRINSKLKSDHTGNIPPNVQSQIDENDKKIHFLVKKLESLFI